MIYFSRRPPNMNNLINDMDKILNDKIKVGKEFKFYE